MSLGQDQFRALLTASRSSGSISVTSNRSFGLQQNRARPKVQHGITQELQGAELTLKPRIADKRGNKKKSIVTGPVSEIENVKA